MVIWLIGLSGAGKTTIGRALHLRWKELEPATVLVDGDEMRRIFAHDQQPSDYSRDGRRRNGERLFEICRWLDNEEINVVCCVLSLFPEMQARNREVFADYFEVFVDVSLERVVERDVKGIYRSAIQGCAENVVGVDIEFPPPPAPDLVIDNNDFDVPPDEWACMIMSRAGIAEVDPRG